MQDTRFRIDPETELIVCCATGDGFQVWIATDAPAVGFDPYDRESGMTCYCVADGLTPQEAALELAALGRALVPALLMLRGQSLKTGN